MNALIYPNLILGFHGCDKTIAKKVLDGEEDLLLSENSYDWLGKGVYFWENDYHRALEFARENSKKEPFVLGAILYLGYCLDLTQRRNAELLRLSYNNLLDDTIKNSVVNRPGKKNEGLTDDLPLRFLDCAVINAIHEFNKEHRIAEYDSVKAAFWEGEPIYKTAGFREKNHIQICIRNKKCILGYFMPRIDSYLGIK